MTALVVIWYPAQYGSRPASSQLFMLYGPEKSFPSDSKCSQWATLITGTDRNYFVRWADQIKVNYQNDENVLRIGIIYLIQYYIIERKDKLLISFKHLKV